MCISSLDPHNKAISPILQIKKQRPREDNVPRVSPLVNSGAGLGHNQSSYRPESIKRIKKRLLDWTKGTSAVTFKIEDL